MCEVMLSEYKKMTIEKISIFWMFPEDLAFSKALTKKFVPMACWAEKKKILVIVFLIDSCASKSNARL